MLRKASSRYLSRFLLKEDIQEIQIDWATECGKIGLNIPKPVEREFKKRIDNAGSKGEKSKLNFYNCSLTDDHVVLLMNVLSDAPIISKLDLRSNPISSISVNAILNLLIKQVHYCQTVQLESRLLVTFLGEVFFDDKADIDASVQDNIRVLSNALKLENARAYIRNEYHQRGSPLVITTAVATDIWASITKKSESSSYYKNEIEPMLSTSATSSTGLDYSILEKSILRTLEMNKIIESVTDRDRILIREQLEKISAPITSSDSKNLILDPHSRLRENEIPVSLEENSHPFDHRIAKDNLYGDYDPLNDRKIQLDLKKKENTVSVGTDPIESPKEEGRDSETSWTSSLGPIAETHHREVNKFPIDSSIHSATSLDNGSMYHPGKATVNIDVVASVLASLPEKKTPSAANKPSPRVHYPVNEFTVIPDTDSLEIFEQSNSTQLKKWPQTNSAEEDPVMPQSSHQEITSHPKEHKAGMAFLGGLIHNLTSHSADHVPIFTRKQKSLPNLNKDTLDNHSRHSVTSLNMPSQKRLAESSEPDHHSNVSLESMSQLSDSTPPSFIPQMKVSDEVNPNVPSSSQGSHRSDTSLATPQTSSTVVVTVPEKYTDNRIDNNDNQITTTETASVSPSVDRSIKSRELSKLSVKTHEKIDVTPFINKLRRSRMRIQNEHNQSLSKSPIKTNTETNSPDPHYHPVPSSTIIVPENLPIQSPKNQKSGNKGYKQSYSSKTKKFSDYLDLSNQSLIEITDKLLLEQAETLGILLTNVSILILRNNDIQDFSSFVHFHYTFPNLIYLDLGGNQLTGKLPLNCLPSPNRLKRLDLSYNYFNDISNIVLFESLEYLNVSHNEIKRIDGLPTKRLIYVDLSFNQLTHVIDLRSIALSKELKSLFIHHNPLCDSSNDMFMKEYSFLTKSTLNSSGNGSNISNQPSNHPPINLRVIAHTLIPSLEEFDGQFLPNKMMKLIQSTKSYQTRANEDPNQSQTLSTSPKQTYNDNYSVNQISYDLSINREEQQKQDQLRSNRYRRQQEYLRLEKIKIEENLSSPTKVLSKNELDRLNKRLAMPTESLTSYRNTPNDPTKTSNSNDPKSFKVTSNITQKQKKNGSNVNKRESTQKSGQSSNNTVKSNDSPKQWINSCKTQIKTAVNALLCAFQLAVYDETLPIDATRSVKGSEDFNDDSSPDMMLWLISRDELVSKFLTELSSVTFFPVVQIPSFIQELLRNNQNIRSNSFFSGNSMKIPFNQDVHMICECRDLVDEMSALSNLLLDLKQIINQPSSTDLSTVIKKRQLPSLKQQIQSIMDTKIGRYVDSHVLIDHDIFYMSILNPSHSDHQYNRNDVEIPREFILTTDDYISVGNINDRSQSHPYSSIKKSHHDDSNAFEDDSFNEMKFSDIYEEEDIDTHVSPYHVKSLEDSAYRQPEIPRNPFPNPLTIVNNSSNALIDSHVTMEDQNQKIPSRQISPRSQLLDHNVVVKYLGDVKKRLTSRMGVMTTDEEMINRNKSSDQEAVIKIKKTESIPIQNDDNSNLNISTTETDDHKAFNATDFEPDETQGTVSLPTVTSAGTEELSHADPKEPASLQKIDDIFTIVESKPLTDPNESQEQSRIAIESSTFEQESKSLLLTIQNEVPLNGESVNTIMNNVRQVVTQETSLPNDATEPVISNIVSSEITHVMETPTKANDVSVSSIDSPSPTASSSSEAPVNSVKQRIKFLSGNKAAESKAESNMTPSAMKSQLSTNPQIAVAPPSNETPKNIFGAKLKSTGSKLIENTAVDAAKQMNDSKSNQTPLTSPTVSNESQSSTGVKQRIQFLSQTKDKPWQSSPVSSSSNLSNDVKLASNPMNIIPKEASDSISVNDSPKTETLGSESQSSTPGTLTVKQRIAQQSSKQSSNSYSPAGTIKSSTLFPVKSPLNKQTKEAGNSLSVASSTDSTMDSKEVTTKQKFQSLSTQGESNVSPTNLKSTGKVAWTSSQLKPVGSSISIPNDEKSVYSSTSMQALESASTGSSDMSVKQRIQALSGAARPALSVKTDMTGKDSENDTNKTLNTPSNSIDTELVIPPISSSNKAGTVTDVQRNQSNSDEKEPQTTPQTSDKPKSSASSKIATSESTANPTPKSSAVLASLVKQASISNNAFINSMSNSQPMIGEKTPDEERQGDVIESKTETQSESQTLTAKDRIRMRMENMKKKKEVEASSEAS